MIHVSRKTKRKGRLVQPPRDWFTAAEEKTKLALVEKDKHVADDNVYGADELRAALEELFHNKCAYCETKLTSFDWDVEHFRPKGRVQERLDHPGYYWLAYKWENLFPSCTHCNQKRKDKPTHDDPSVGDAAGKADQFPVADEAKRAMTPRSRLSNEEPLLLDPCADQPEEHLLFANDGSVMPVTGSRKGEASIRVYNLKRRRLKTARREVIEQVVPLLQQVLAMQRKGLQQEAGIILSLIEKTHASAERLHAGVVRLILKDPAQFGVG